jgi:hypothetical protein
VEQLNLTPEQLDPAIWDAGDCAAYFKVSRKHFLREIRFRDDFPPQLDWSLVGRPRWSAQDVKTWALLRRHYATAA